MSGLVDTPSANAGEERAAGNRFRFLGGITRADLAFEVAAESPERLFQTAAEAVLAATVDAPDLLRARSERRFFVEADAWDRLLYRALEELLYRRDAEGLLLRFHAVQITRGPGDELRAEITACGEAVEEFRGEFLAEVKAITFHELRVEQVGARRWRAVVVLDL